MNTGDLYEIKKEFYHIFGNRQRLDWALKQAKEGKISTLIYRGDADRLLFDAMEAKTSELVNYLVTAEALKPTGQSVLKGLAQLFCSYENWAKEKRRAGDDVFVLMLEGKISREIGDVLGGMEIVCKEWRSLINDVLAESDRAFTEVELEHLQKEDRPEPQPKLEGADPELEGNDEGQEGDDEGQEDEQPRHLGRPRVSFKTLILGKNKEAIFERLKELMKGENPNTAMHILISWKNNGRITDFPSYSVFRDTFPDIEIPASTYKEHLKKYR